MEKLVTVDDRGLNENFLNCRSVVCLVDSAFAEQDRVNQKEQRFFYLFTGNDCPFFGWNMRMLLTRFEANRHALLVAQTDYSKQRSNTQYIRRGRGWGEIVKPACGSTVKSGCV